MGLFKKKPQDPSEIERLKGEIASMAARLDAADADKQQLGDQVRGLSTRLDTPPEPPPPPPAPEPTVSPDEFRAIVNRVREITTRLDATEQPPVDDEPTVDHAAFESVSQEVHTLGERIDEFDTVREQVHSVATRLDQLDARITSISNELANQITELSSDLESLNGHEAAPELVDRLRDTQIKLANEQARYQIAFREDLAHLADFLRHH